MAMLTARVTIIRKCLVVSKNGDNGTGTIRDNLDFEIAKMRQEEY